MSQPLTHADATVVLSGAATFRERANYAARIFNEGRSFQIILTNDGHRSGWASATQRNPYYYERAIDELQRAGVPRLLIEVVAPSVDSTYDEAVLLREYCDSHGVNSLLIVTSSYHSRRALWTFRRLFQGSKTDVGLEAVGVGIDTPSPPTWWLHLRGWQMVPTEYLKIVYYWVRF